jgi:CheY-like chemotaxis protein
VSKIVLCVDDSATMQMVADITFRGTEFTYVGARNGDEALEKARASKPALILADAQMPGKSGYDLCLALKSDAKTADVPVVILIGNGAPFDASRGAQVGADANLPKPWDTQTMLEKVIEIVGRGTSVKPGSTAPPLASAAPTVSSSAPTTPLPGGKSVPSPATAAAAAASANMPPRSATIMGMPTIKMPGGVAPTAISAPLAAPAAPAAATPAPVAAAAQAAAPNVVSTNKTTPSHVPPVSQSGASRQPAPPAPAQLHTAARAPMVSGTATKRSALVERTLAKMAAQLAAAAGLEPGSPELLALLKLSTEIVERIVWEVVPELAEAIIKENLHDLTARRS